MEARSRSIDLAGPAQDEAFVVTFFFGALLGLWQSALDVLEVADSTAMTVLDELYVGAV